MARSYAVTAGADDASVRVLTRQPVDRERQHSFRWLLGGSTREMKSALALGTAQRNIAAALVVGGQNFDDPTVVVMIAVVAIVGLAVLMPLARQLSKSTQQSSAERF